MKPVAPAAFANNLAAGGPDRAAAPTNVLIVGVGGQGVLMISRVLALLCQEQNLRLKQSETHGMAKRGGVVSSHVRFGHEVRSPTIPMGEADILIAMEWAEGLRWLPYLKPGRGTFIADTQQIVPPFAYRDRRRGAASSYVGTTVEEVADKVPNSFALDATRIAAELGNPQTANTVLLGALSMALDFHVEEWQQAIAELVPPKTVEVNQQAFLKGRDWVAGGGAVAQMPATPAVPVAFEGVRFEITEAWCKGCDICVKMCPERCLVLNDNQVAELADPDRCTGCRVCEWLCPDFAITIRRVSAQGDGG